MADLNLMAIFARVVEAGSFSEAARRMGCSRSAVSKAVAKLETLMAKREEIRTKELMIAIASSDRSYEEGLRFIKG